MDSIEFRLGFSGASGAQANRWAGELKQILEDAHRDVRITQEREVDETMDLGSVLSVVVGSISLVDLVARGIKAFQAKNPGATLEISKDGDVKATNLKSKDVVALAEILTRSKKS